MDQNTMMESPLRFFFALLIIALSSVAGGGVLAYALAGREAGLEFIIIGLAVVVVVSIFQILLLRHAANRMAFWMLLYAAGLLNVAWAFAAASVPLFWVFSLTSWQSITLAICFFFALLSGYYRFSGHFQARWQHGGVEKVRATIIDSAGELHFKIITDLKIFPGSFLPAYFKKVDSIVLGLSVISIIVGMNLRKVFPVYSALAWGIPALFFCAYMICASGSLVSVAKELFRLEKELGFHIRPMSAVGAGRLRAALWRRKKNIK